MSAAVPGLMQEDRLFRFSSQPRSRLIALVNSLLLVGVLMQEGKSLKRSSDSPHRQQKFPMRVLTQEVKLPELDEYAITVLAK
ncbi:MAG: hypothetical protein ACFB16_22615 [Phormidesmis sp.]